MRQTVDETPENIDERHLIVPARILEQVHPRLRMRGLAGVET